MTPRWTIGVAGHVDHGKTSLVRVLTGVDTDRKPEEKMRGLSIETGIAQLRLPSGRETALVDVPGHTDFLKNAIRGLSCVDAAILVVAADDGVMPQTREHLDILSFFRASRGIVIISKADLVDTETIEIAKLEIEELLAGSFLENAPIIPFSAHQPVAKNEIITAIDQIVGQAPTRRGNTPFRMWIDQLHSFAGFGTVVSGTVLSGKLRQGAPLEILPLQIQTRARTMESHGQKIEEAVRGQRVGINLPKVDMHLLARGMVVAEPETVRPSHLLNAELHVPADAGQPVKNRQKVKLHIGTALIIATVILMEKDMLGPGESGLVQLRLQTRIAAKPKDAFAATLMNVPKVIAGGTILEVPHAKFRPVKGAAIIAYLNALKNGDLEAFVECFFRHRPHRFLTAKELAHMTGFSEKALHSVINSKVSRGKCIYFKGRGAVLKDHYLSIKDKVYMLIRTKVEADPVREPITPSEITAGISDKVDEDLIMFAADELIAKKRIIKSGGGFHMAGALERFSPLSRNVSATVEKFAEKSGIKPFSPDTIWKEYKQAIDKNEIQRIFDFLCKENRLVRLRDNRFLSVGALEEIKLRVKKAIEVKGGITLADSTDILGYGRWGGAPVFDYLDKIGFTTRIGNERKLRNQCLTRDHGTLMNKYVEQSKDCNSSKCGGLRR